MAELFQAEKVVAVIPTREKLSMLTAVAEKKEAANLLLTFQSAYNKMFAGYMATNAEASKSNLKNGLDHLSRELFKGAEVKYESNEKTKVYSVKATLNERPVVYTLRVGPDFSEISMADLNSRQVEAVREVKGKFGFERTTLR